MRRAFRQLMYLTLMTVLAISSCKPEEGVIIDNPFESCEDAIIRDYGEPALDGCGWVVDVSTIIYKPVNLLEEFEIDGLEVLIKYDILDSTNCGMVQFAFNAISINEIYKKP